MPSIIYKVTIVYSVPNKVCLYKHIEEVPLPQPISVRFSHSVKNGDGWEEHVYWFWHMEHAQETLMSVPLTQSTKPVYNKPAWTDAQKQAQQERIKKLDKELHKMKKERTLEKRRVNTSG
jgi:hypothetical protein